jgi:hypothetical protein
MGRAHGARDGQGENCDQGSGKHTGGQEAQRQRAGSGIDERGAEFTRLTGGERPRTLAYDVLISPP